MFKRLKCMLEGAVKARHRQLRRGERSLRLTVSAQPAIVAEAELQVSGVRDGVDGQWVIRTAIHRLDSQSGYLTDVEAEAKV